MFYNCILTKKRWIDYTFFLKAIYECFTTLVAWFKHCLQIQTSLLTVFISIIQPSVEIILFLIPLHYLVHHPIQFHFLFLKLLVKLVWIVVLCQVTDELVEHHHHIAPVHPCTPRPGSIKV